MVIRWLAPLALLLTGLFSQGVFAAPAPQDASQGQAVFAGLGCSGCHGDSAQGFIGPRLSGTTLTLEQFMSQVRNPAASMPAYPQSIASDTQLLNVYAYVRGLGGLPPFPETARSQDEGGPIPEGEPAPVMPLPTGGSAGTVEMRDLAFIPDTVTIAAGSTVTWTNQDVEPHTATSTSFDTGLMLRGQSSTITFAQIGTFSYFCDFHPLMVGTVEVV